MEAQRHLARNEAEGNRTHCRHPKPGTTPSVESPRLQERGPPRICASVQSEETGDR